MGHCSINFVGLGLVLRQEVRSAEHAKFLMLCLINSSCDGWELVLTLAFPEGDCLPNAFPILRRVPRLPSQL